MQENNTDIEAMIREEKRLSANECHDEAWESSALAGIEADIIAESAMATALRELQEVSGEKAALTLLDHMRERVLSGHFDSSAIRH